MPKNRNSIRAFIAVDVNRSVRDRAEELIRLLADSGTDVKWVEPHNLHLTLKFLGDVQLTETAAVCDAVAKAAEGIGPFDLAFRSAGAFPDVKRPRTLWLGVQDDSRQLGRLFKNLEDRLQKLRFSKESRKFEPHLTIGRLRHGGTTSSALSELLAKQAHFDAGTTTINQVIVYSSQLTPGGPIYDALGRVALRQEKG